MPDKKSSFFAPAEKHFGSYDIWRADFASVGTLRGVGWAICYQNPTTDRLSDHQISLHEFGNVSGFVPVLVMDVWEPGYLLDYKPAERSRYVDAFFSNIDWDTLDKRLVS